jgi:hypothetical protein
LDNRTPYTETTQDDLFTVVDPESPTAALLSLSPLSVSENIGGVRRVATSPDRRQLAVIDETRLWLYDETLALRGQTSTTLSFSAVYPTDDAVFALESSGTISSGVVVRYSGTLSDPQRSQSGHGVDLVVDVARQLVWSVGADLTKVTLDLENFESKHSFEWAAVSLDLDSAGGIWAAERAHSQIATSANRLVHFDATGALIAADTLDLPGSPFAVRVERSSGIVWVAMLNAGVAYRDPTSKELVPLPEISGSWTSLDTDPSDSSAIWAAETAGARVLKLDTSGNELDALTGYGSDQKWIAVWLDAP